MSIPDMVFSGLGGAVIASVVSWVIYVKSQTKPSGKAYSLLKVLGKRLKEPEGEYHFTKSTDDNYHVAREIYAHADGDVIATAFNESPVKYGDSDIARAFKYGSRFSRITCEDVCAVDAQQAAAVSLTRILKGSTLAVVPRGQPVTKIDGVFCRFDDDTHLCFIAFRNPDDPDQKNTGVIFRNGIAEGFFNYYRTITDKYTTRA